MSQTTVLGIRHHGPGSARSLLRALDALRPDCLLVEGPPDADALLPLAADPEIEPPVALLLYRQEAPGRRVFYPFAEFSPEWQAIRYALRQRIPVRFMDLPICHQLADEPAAQGVAERAEEIPEGMPEAAPATDTPAAASGDDADESTSESPTPDDPLGWLARAAGYADGENWWETTVEQRLDGADLFAAIGETMAALRAEFPTAHGAEREARREAYMRRTLRQAQKEGFEHIAVVCGAWHVPALEAEVKIKDDNALLRALPKAKIEATWVPWTYGRLAQSSGYGAGVASPGWYHHLWKYRAPATDSESAQAPGSASSSADVAIRWLTRVARLLREQDLDASSAHVIEAVRLAEALTSMRQRPLPSLAELNEAAITVLCFGDETPLRLIQRQLIVGERLGRVPPAAPTVPLQRDLEAEQKRLRLKPSAIEESLDLDLRKPNGLARSHLLHRLGLLGIPWGELQQAGGRAKGTFHEIWKLCWQPEFAVQVIEASIWGTTVARAAEAHVHEQARDADLPLLSQLVDQVLLADLSGVLDVLMQRLETAAAETADTLQLLDAIPPLVQVLRYGDVRGTATAPVERVLDGLVVRACIGLPLAGAGLDEEASADLAQRVTRVDSALRLLDGVSPRDPDQRHLPAWQRALGQVMRSVEADTSSQAAKIHGHLSGRCCRLLLDASALAEGEAARLMHLALSRGNDRAAAAGWLQGFLSGSGMVLLHDDRLWAVLDDWLVQLSADAFVEVLPLVRRTFADFPEPERQQMGRRVRAHRSTHPSTGPPASTDGPAAGDDLDTARAARVLPMVRLYLGLPERLAEEESTS